MLPCVPPSLVLAIYNWYCFEVAWYCEYRKTKSYFELNSGASKAGLWELWQMGCSVHMECLRMT